MSKVRVCVSCGNEFEPKHGPCKDCRSFGYYHSTTRIFDEVPRKTKSRVCGPFFDVAIFDTYEDFYQAYRISPTPEVSMDWPIKRYVDYKSMIDRINTEITNLKYNKALRTQRPCVIISFFFLSTGAREVYAGELEKLNLKDLNLTPSELSQL